LTLLSEYRKWSDFHYEWQVKRQKSIKAVNFPFPYRSGQKELVTYVYQTIYHQKKLFIQAPTGVGKTISTIFPAVKAVGEGKADKIFYLTAKTITRTVATDTVQLLRGQGLCCKSVVLTAKDKICFTQETDCNPESCPYAKGHFDRINDAIYELLLGEDNFDRDTIELYARKHSVCPFEMALDMSLFADLIICDYNYLFDPYVYLRRFFTDGVKGEYLFLMDEAHNLVERGREMYSAGLLKEDFLALKRVVKPYSTKLERQLEKCNKELLALKKECDGACVIENCGAFVMALARLKTGMSKYLEDHDDSPVRKEILEFYFEISRFLDVNEVLDDNYVVYTQLLSDGSFLIRQYCVDPSGRLAECMDRGRSSILFSATFLPIQYYKALLGGTGEDYEVYAHTAFEADRRKLVIGNQVTSKYTRRSPQEYDRIAAYIYELIQAKEGNYLVFFPSHLFLEQVYLAYLTQYETERVTCLVQSGHMSESDREAFLARFEEESGGTLLGFCVLGGIFGEGIDLTHDKLIGALIVGTGLPQVCFEREILKQHFDKEGKNGFDYAYRYPGMNKVLQAAGRVIRTREDIGMVALLDERFLEASYQKMFPREWEHFEIVSVANCKEALRRFWNGFSPA
ncbi:MAG: ATP-dependent DNA helicase, partial [Lachnospiraceae bacterium]|nr:ATP-dependent DNA helicase [Lachnospiraceae bacterium]